MSRLSLSAALLFALVLLPLETSLAGNCREDSRRTSDIDDNPLIKRSFDKPRRSGEPLAERKNLRVEDIKEDLAQIEYSARALKNEVDRITKEKLAVLEQQLSPAEKVTRRRHDPRRFASWGLRKDKTNPHTISLKSQKRSLEAEIQSLNDLRQAMNSLLELRNNKNFFDTDIEIQILDWMLLRLEAIHQNIKKGETGGLDQIQTILEEINTFKESNAGLEPGNKFNPIVAKYRQHLYRELNFVKTAEKLMGRTLDNHIVDRLLLFTSNFSMEFGEVVKEFKQMDDAFATKRKEIKERAKDDDLPEGLHDNFIIPLLGVKLANRGLTIEQVADRFLETSQLGRTMGGKILGEAGKTWTIDDHAVTLLTVYSFSSGQKSASPAVEMFYKTVKAKTDNTAIDKYSFSDADFARMSIATKVLKVSNEQILMRQIELYELGKTQEEDYHIHDYSVIELIRIGERFQLDNQQLIDQYFKIARETKKPNGDKWLIDSDITSLMWIANGLNIKTADVLTIFSRFKTQAPEITTRKILFILHDLSVRGIDLTRLSNKEIQELNWNTHFSWRNLSDWLFLAERNRQARRQRSSSGSSRSSRSSSYDSESDNFGDVGIIFGVSDGIGIGVGIGGGMSIDISDGSLAVGGFDMW